MVTNKMLKEAIQAAVEAHAACPGSTRVFGDCDLDKVADMARALLAVYGWAEQLLARPNKSIGAEVLIMFVAYGDGAQPPAQRMFSEEQFREALSETYRARGECMVECVVDDTMRRLRCAGEETLAPHALCSGCAECKP